MNRVITVRLPDKQVAELEKLAAFDNVAIATEIRDAITHLIEKRREEPEFVERVRAAYARARDELIALGQALPGEAEQVVEALGEFPESMAGHGTVGAEPQESRTVAGPISARTHARFRAEATS